MHTTETPTAGETAAEHPHPHPAPLTVTTRGLAVLLAMPYSTITKLCAAKAWQDDEMPTPLFIGAGSSRGDGSGARRWAVTHVQRWLDERAGVGA